MAVHNYVVNKNKALQEEIDSKYAQTYMTESDEAWVEKLKSQIRSTSIFDKFDFLNSQAVSTDHWGEPDPLEHDFSVEEMFELPTITELDIETDKVGFDGLGEINVNNLLGNEEFAELF